MRMIRLRSVGSIQYSQSRTKRSWLKPRRACVIDLEIIIAGSSCHPQLTVPRKMEMRLSQLLSQFNTLVGKVLRDKACRPCQPVEVVQRLVWLCRPMREWQSLLLTASMKMKEGRVELFLR